MPAATSVRADWPISTFTYTQRCPPAACRRSRSASSADVLPVCRGACSTKYRRWRDQAQHALQVEPLERGDAVVLPRIDRPGGVEEAHRGILAFRPARGAAAAGRRYRDTTSNTPVTTTAEQPSDHGILAFRPARGAAAAGRRYRDTTSSTPVTTTAEQPSDHGDSVSPASR